MVFWGEFSQNEWSQIGFSSIIFAHKNLKVLKYLIAPRKSFEKNNPSDSFRELFQEEETVAFEFAIAFKHEISSIQGLYVYTFITLNFYPRI